MNTFDWIKTTVIMTREVIDVKSLQDMHSLEYKNEIQIYFKNDQFL